MQKEIVQAYVELLHQIILAGDTADLSAILNQLDGLKDGTDAMLASFQKKGTEMPAYWISYLRVIKFAQNYRASYTRNYDFYYRLYDYLHSMPSRNTDQERMVQEIGKMLYAMDDLSGRLDRAVTGLVEALRNGILESHNIVTESKDRILASKVPQKAIQWLDDPYHELTAVTTEIIASLEHERSLYRLSRLMAPPEILNADS